MIENVYLLAVMRCAVPLKQIELQILLVGTKQNCFIYIVKIKFLFERKK